MKYAVLMTLLLVGLLFFYYVKYDRPRTLHAALQKVEGDPLSFSADSGFFENSFVLQLTADSRIPQEKSIEIRYTVNGDEPTQDSFLYDGGIDLAKMILRAKEEAAVKAAEKAEIEKRAEEEKKAEAEKLNADTAADGNASAEEAEGETEKTDDNADGPAASPEQTGTEGQDASSDPYSLQNQRRQWEEEKYSASSDNGVYVKQEDDGIYVIPVRARLVQGDDMSAVVTRTFVIGEGVFERYDGYVACLSTDSRNLFDYDNGIMVKGSHYQKDIDDGKREDRSGNFYQEGDEWIKYGHVTLFSPEGEVLLEEDTGITVGGYSSRGLPTRTLRVEASPAMGSSGQYFRLDIFKKGSYSRAGNLLSIETDAPGADSGVSAVNVTGGWSAQAAGTEKVLSEPDAFNKVRFRTHGIPQYHIRSVRNKYARILSDACGFPGLPDARLGIAYLNGEFYTICDVTPSVTKEYMCALFGLGTPDAIEKYESSDYDVYTRTKILPLFNADLTQQENQKALEEAVDMDNYLFYFALEVLFNNADWPFNNVSMWRYVGEQDPENPYTDGRYRFILDDMDQILTNDLHGVPEQWSSELIDYLMKDKGNTFCHVMQCSRYRDTFLTYVDDLLKTAFEPDYACAVLDALYEDMEKEYIRDYGGAFWAEMVDTAYKTKNNVREKEELYRANIKKYMGLDERYSVRIEAGEGACITWNNMTVSPGASWSNEYYCGTSFTVAARAEQGYRITGWEVNGTFIEADADSASRDTAMLAVSDALASGGTAGSSDPSAESSKELSEESSETSGFAGEEAVKVTVRALAERIP